MQQTGKVIGLGTMDATDLAAAGLLGVTVGLSCGRTILIAGLTQGECRALVPLLNSDVVLALRAKNGEEA